MVKNVAYSSKVHRLCVLQVFCVCKGENGDMSLGCRNHRFPPWPISRCIQFVKRRYSLVRLFINREMCHLARKRWSDPSPGPLEPKSLYGAKISDFYLLEYVKINHDENPWFWKPWHGSGAMQEMLLSTTPERHLSGADDTEDTIL